MRRFIGCVFVDTWVWHVGFCGSCCDKQPHEREERERAEKLRLADEAASTAGNLFGDADGLWNENGPWPETYRVGMKVPTVPKNAPGSTVPSLLFVNLVVSVEIDADLLASETREWNKFDSETRLNRDRERQARMDRKQRAKERAILDAEVRV